MNPAMNFGLNVVNTAFDGGALWGYHYIDWVGPLLGTILATILFRYVFVFSSYILEENNKSPFWGIKVFLFFFFLLILLGCCLPARIDGSVFGKSKRPSPQLVWQTAPWTETSVRKFIVLIRSSNYSSGMCDGLIKKKKTQAYTHTETRWNNDWRRNLQNGIPKIFISSLRSIKIEVYFMF